MNNWYQDYQHSKYYQEKRLEESKHARMLYYIKKRSVKSAIKSGNTANNSTWTVSKIIGRILIRIGEFLLQRGMRLSGKIKTMA